MGTRLRNAGFVLVLALAFVGVAACGGGGNEISTGGDADPTSTTTGGATGGEAQDLVLDVAFLRNGKLAIAHRDVAPTQAVGRAALEQLLAGPSADDGATFTSAVAAGTRLDAIDIAGGVATVELTPAVTDPTARAQIVFTLTQFPTVDAVRFGASGPSLGRDDVTAALGSILVESVAPADTVSSPVKIAGLNNTFESNVRLRVLGADGRVLVDTFTTGKGQVGQWGPFEAAVTFERGTDTRGTIVAFTNSAETGAMTGVVEIPVQFGS